MAFAAGLGSEAPLNDLTTLATLLGFRVSEVAAGARLAWEEAAAGNGVPLALSDLELWRAMGLGPGSTFSAIHDEHDRLVGSFAVQRWPSNALPGHCILRLERLGESIPGGAEPAAVAAALALARRARIAGALQAAGFYRKDRLRTYDRTLAIDLQRGDEALLGSFSARACRQIRRAERFPLSVITIEDDALVPRLEAIHRETFARSGMQAPAQPWVRLIAGAHKAPSRVRIFWRHAHRRGHGGLPRGLCACAATRHLCGV